MPTVKPVLVDSSSAILLYKVDLFDLLVRTYRIFIAKAVYREIGLPGYPGAGVFRNFCRNNYMTVLPAVSKAEMASEIPPALKSLDSGERETILQYAQTEAVFIIIDDGQGSAYCRDNGIPNVNALLVARILYLAGKIPKMSYQAMLAGVIEQGRYSQEIIKYGCGCSEQSLVYFMP